MEKMGWKFLGEIDGRPPRYIGRSENLGVGGVYPGKNGIDESFFMAGFALLNDLGVGEIPASEILDCICECKRVVECHAE